MNKSVSSVLELSKFCFLSVKAAASAANSAKPPVVANEEHGIYISTLRSGTCSIYSIIQTVYIVS